MLSRLAIDDEQDVQAAVKEDTEYVVRILKALQVHPDGNEGVIALGGDSTLAQSFLALIGQVRSLL